MNKRIVSYDEYGKLLNSLVSQIQYDERSSKLRYIYGIPRGGLPISVHLAHYLELEVLKNLPYYTILNAVLLVDDIADTGETLKSYRHFNYLTATLFYKERSSIEPDFYVEQTKDWIVFPWEKFEEVPNRPE